MTDPFPPYTPDPSEWRWKFTPEAVAWLEKRDAEREAQEQLEREIEERRVMYGGKR